MNRDEAADLATRITATWRGGPTATIWTEELELLHQGTAGTAYARLRRDEEHAPSIAKFLAVYRALHTNEADKPKCDICDTTGWIEAPELVKGDPDNGGHRYSQVVPCLACEYGAQAKRIHPQILERNTRPT